MTFEGLLPELRQALNQLGLSLTEHQWAVVVVALFAIAILLASLPGLVWLIRQARSILSRLQYDETTRDFVRARSQFVGNLTSEVRRIMTSTNWSDSEYVPLEAEVEIDDPWIPEASGSLMRSLAPALRTMRGVGRILLRPGTRRKVVKNLAQALERSKARAFVVIGDPGSGKTVSLQHLFLKLADECKSSRNMSARVPLYLNLKRLDLNPDDVKADRIHDWVIAQIAAEQDRTVARFIEKNFDRMFAQGQFFFLFDSFDEIRSVADASEGSEVIEAYANALDRFINAAHGCRGLVTSRPFRSPPRTFQAQRLTVLPLQDYQVRGVLRKRLVQDSALARRTWGELAYGRTDLLPLVRNPFYLGLLAEYVERDHALPRRQYDLFDRFVRERAQEDATRLKQFGLTPDELLLGSEILAFAMTRDSGIGFEPVERNIADLLSSGQVVGALASPVTPRLLDALCFSKLARRAQRSTGDTTFSFAHRRFQEFFCARFLLRQPDTAPIRDLMVDNRWREVLVLLCEVLPISQLTEIFETGRRAISRGMRAGIGTTADCQGVETVRFLKDAFRSRLADVPAVVRSACSAILYRQVFGGDPLACKRALEALPVAEIHSSARMVSFVLEGDSFWLREAALTTCRVFSTKVPNQVIESVRSHVHEEYAHTRLFRTFSTYDALLSVPLSLRSLRSYLRALHWAAWLQVAFYGLLAGYLASVDVFVGGMALFMAWVYLFLFPRIDSILGQASHKRSSREAHTGNRSASRSSIVTSTWFLFPAAVLMTMLFGLYFGIVELGLRQVISPQLAAHPRSAWSISGPIWTMLLSPAGIGILVSAVCLSLSNLLVSRGVKRRSKQSAWTYGYKLNPDSPETKRGRHPAVQIASRVGDWISGRMSVRGARTLVLGLFILAPLGAGLGVRAMLDMLAGAVSIRHYVLNYGSLWGSIYWLAGLLTSLMMVLSIGSTLALLASSATTLFRLVRDYFRVAYLAARAAARPKDIGEAVSVLSRLHSTSVKAIPSPNELTL